MAGRNGRDEFLERIRRQVRSRHPGVDVDVDPESMSARVRGPGIDSTLPLGTLFQGCVRDPDHSGTLIAAWMRSIERQLAPAAVVRLNRNHLLWCVRSERSLAPLQRSAELVRRDVAGAAVAFIAETLPEPAMRGVPLGDLEAAGLSESEARAAADANTAARFAALPQRIRGTERVPADGWRLGSDQLFQGSVVLIPDVLAAFAERAGGEVLIGIPDRSEVLAMPAALPNADRFGMRVMRAYREAMNPCTSAVLVTDGTELRTLATGRRRAGAELLPWLRG